MREAPLFLAQGDFFLWEALLDAVGQKKMERGPLALDALN
jgi:hypothetical protein